MVVMVVVVLMVARTKKTKKLDVRGGKGKIVIECRAKMITSTNDSDRFVIKGRGSDQDQQCEKMETP